MAPPSFFLVGVALISASLVCSTVEDNTTCESMEGGAFALLQKEQRKVYPPPHISRQVAIIEHDANTDTWLSHTTKVWASLEAVVKRPLSGPIHFAKSWPQVRWLYLVAAVLAEISSAYFIKKAKGFKNLGATATGFALQLTDDLFLFCLLQAVALSTTYAVFTQIEIVGTALVGVLVLGDALSTLAKGAFVAGVVGITLMGLSGHRDLSLSSLVGTRLEEAVLCVSALAIMAVVLALSTSFLVNMSLRTKCFVQYSSLFGAVVFEIFTGMTMYNGYLVAALLCSAAKQACSGIYLKYWDLSIGWALAATCDCLGVEILSITVFGDRLSHLQVVGLLCIMTSVVVFALEEADEEHADEDEEDFAETPVEVAGAKAERGGKIW